MLCYQFCDVIKYFGFGQYVEYGDQLLEVIGLVNVCWFK